MGVRVARTRFGTERGARGDAAFRARRWAQAESLYALRARKGGPVPLRGNLATARALAGRPAEAAQELSRLAADPGPAGQTAGYNLGTLLGQGGEIERALGELRRAIERDPDDADARFNYELLRRRQKQSLGKDDPKPNPQPKPSPGQNGDQDQPQPKPDAQSPPRPQDPQPQNAPNAPSPQQNNPSPGPNGQGMPGMTKQQAEQLLSSLGELEKLEQARLKRMRVLRDRKGKDW